MWRPIPTARPACGGHGGHDTSAVSPLEEQLTYGDAEQWWRAVTDNGHVEKGSEHAALLVENGFDVEDVDDELVVVKDLADKLMSWEVAEEPVEAEAEEA